MCSHVSACECVSLTVYMRDPLSLPVCAVCGESFPAGDAYSTGFGVASWPLRTQHLLRRDWAYLWLLGIWQTDRGLVPLATQSETHMQISNQISLYNRNTWQLWPWVDIWLVSFRKMNPNMQLLSKELKESKCLFGYWGEGVELGIIIIIRLAIHKSNKWHHKDSETNTYAQSNALWRSLMVGSLQAECSTNSLMQYKGELTVMLKYIPAERNLSLPLDQIQGTAEKCHWISPCLHFLLMETCFPNVLQ